jgi:hypothetical protein
MVLGAVKPLTCLLEETTHNVSPILVAAISPLPLGCPPPILVDPLVASCVVNLWIRLAAKDLERERNWTDPSVQCFFLKHNIIKTLFFLAFDNTIKLFLISKEIP